MIGHDLKVAVDSATMVLREAGVPSPSRDAVVLAAHLLAVDPAEVHRLMLLGWGKSPHGYEDLVAERARRVPLQHLTGVAWFRGLELAVGPGVFVPRPETEMLVDIVTDYLERRAGAGTVVDLCTGSGAIALSIKDEAPAVTVYAVELEVEALAWAQQNLDRLGLAVTLVGADAATALPELDGTVDVVVSNPPYIPPGQVPVDPEVRDHDPRPALYGGGGDGLRTPLAVAARAADLLVPGGLFVMEHAECQGDAVTRALEATGHWDGVCDLPDLTGRSRCLVATRGGGTVFIPPVAQAQAQSPPARPAVPLAEVIPLPTTTRHSS